MSFIDDHYGDLIYEQAELENCINRYVRTANNSQVLTDIKSVVYDSEYDTIPLAVTNRAIIQTVERQKGRMSERQKWCFCKFLVDVHDDYNVDHDVDNPLKN